MFLLSGQEFGLRFRTEPSIRGKYVDYIGKVGAAFLRKWQKRQQGRPQVNLISILKENAVGILTVREDSHVHGYVNSTPDFTEQPYVIDGASELLVELFGDKGTFKMRFPHPPAPRHLC